MYRKSKYLEPVLHKKPVTRREFLAQGLIGFSAVSFLPTPLGILSRAYGATCGASSTKQIPFLVFDCAGGAALPANFLATDEKGDLLPSYDQLGWNPKQAEALDSTFGLPMAKNVSKILEGMSATLSVDAKARLRLGSFCHFATSDSGENPLSAVGLIAKLGYQGSLVTAPSGMQNSSSGGNSKAAYAQPEMRALYVPNVESLLSVVGLSATSALGNLKPGLLGKAFQSGQRLSALQLAQIEQSATVRLLGELAECAYKENERKLSGSVVVDARREAIMQQIYEINPDSPADSFSVVSATIVKGTLEGTLGPGVIVIGGCDYHDGTSTTGDAKDLEIGLSIGRAVEAAHQKKRPLFFQLITDGGCSNRVGSRIWISDANDKCMTVIGYYRPEGAPTQKRMQVGWFGAGQGAVKEAISGLGQNPAKVAASVFANYLSLQVTIAQLPTELFKYVPSNLFSEMAEVEKVLIF